MGLKLPDSPALVYSRFSERLGARFTPALREETASRIG